MRMYAPKIISGEAKDAESETYKPLYLPKNPEVLEKINTDPDGKVKFDDTYLNTDAICVNVPGTLTEATTVRVLLPFDVGIPANWANSLGKSVTPPSAPKSIGIYAAGTLIGSATLMTDRRVEFSGLDEDGMHLTAGTELAFNLDSLVNSGASDFSISIYVLK